MAHNIASSTASDRKPHAPLLPYCLSAFGAAVILKESRVLMGVCKLDYKAAFIGQSVLCVLIKRANDQ